MRIPKKFFMLKRIKNTAISVTEPGSNIQVSNEKSFQYLLDALKGYVEGNIYQRNDFFFQRFGAARQVFSKNLFDSLSVQTMPGRIIEIFAVLGSSNNINSEFLYKALAIAIRCC